MIGESAAITDSTCAVRSYMAEARAVIEGLGIHPRQAHRYTMSASKS
jgi:hypothetical protein